MKKILNNTKSLRYIIPIIIMIAFVGITLGKYTSPKVSADSVNEFEIYTSPDENVQNEKSASNNQANQLSAEELPSAEITTRKTPSLSDVTDENNTYKDGKYYGTGTGFDGEITVEVTIKDGKISAIRVVKTSDGDEYMAKATALLDKIISSQSTDVDTVSGATYSSVGLIEAVRDALSKAATDSSGVQSETNAQTATSATSQQSGKTAVNSSNSANATYRDGTFYGTGTGYRGKVTVAVTIKNSKIQNIKVISSVDDEPFFTRATALLKTIKSKQTTDVDVVSGATYSSKGLIEAVNNALSKATVQKQSTTAAAQNPTTATNKTSVQSNTKRTNSNVNLSTDYSDGLYFGTGEGYRGDIEVAVTIIGGKIQYIQVTKSSDDDPYFTNAKSLLDVILKKQTPNVDTVSGATFSSYGIIDAVTDALKNAAKVAATTNTTTQAENTTQPSTTQSAQTTPNGLLSSNNLKYKDGTFRAQVTCEPDDMYDFDPYTLSLDVTIENDTIIAITNIEGAGSDYTSDNDWYINYAANGTKRVKGIIPTVIENNGTDGVDVVSSATCSSNAIIEAINKALLSAKN